MSASPTWVAVAPADEVDVPPWPCRDVAGLPVRLLRTPGGDILAVGASCPHLDSPLDRAEVEPGPDGEQVLCPRHWYAYDAASGQNRHPALDSSAPLPVYPVEVRDGIVHVRVPVHR
jgi:nitrite reductase/ring-hydroxylating ferredoxin subunit